MSNIMQYRDATDTGPNPSPSIWASCPVLEFMRGNGGIFLHEDFLTFPDIAGGTTVAAYGLWELLAENGSGTLMHGVGQSVAAAVATMGGMVNLVAGTTADIDCVLQYGGGGAFSISDAAADARRLWFEARFNITNITNGVSSFFVGLAEPDRTIAEGLFTDAHAFASIGAIGFFRPDADGDGLDFMYNGNGQVATTSIADGATLVADTCLKCGFIYDPNASAAERITWYLNGGRQTTRVTATQIAAATFPDAEILTPTLGIKNDDGSSASTLVCDWIRVAQERF